MQCDTRFCGHELVSDEQDTVKTMLQEAEKIQILPNHCIDINNEMQGFRLTVSENAKGSSLCVNRHMFFGHSLFECFSSDHVINQDVVRIMANDNTNTMHALLDSFKHKHVPTFDNIPDNTDSFLGTEDFISYNISYAKGKRSVDSKPWLPDMPQSMGLYHAMVRGYQKDVRQHKLFIVVSGGCNKCCDMFYNLMMDVGDQWTAKEVYDSEEVWWLRKACQRSRCMIASKIARKFGLKIHEDPDVHSFHPQKIGVPTVDTVEHNITISEPGYVSVTNHCCETMMHQNGILCSMNPVEGYWLFRGHAKSSTKMTNFGSLHGCEFGVFPTNAPCYKPGLGSQSYVSGYDNRLVVRSSDSASNNTGHVFQCFDEHFMRNLESMGWNRDHGVCELMPLIVGCS